MIEGIEGMSLFQRQGYDPSIVTFPRSSGELIRWIKSALDRTLFTLEDVLFKAP
jgi:hypothetical protein